MVGQIGTLIAFANATIADATEVNQNFADIKAAFNALVTGTNALNIDTIAEVTAAAGVTIDGVLLKDSAVTASGGVKADTVDENTAAAGVTIDGLLVKDSKLQNARVALTGQGGSERNDIGDVSTDQTIDWDNGNSQRLRLTGNIALTALNNGQPGFTYVLEIDRTGSFTITNLATVVNFGAVGAPTQSTGAGEVDVVSLYYNGTEYFGIFAKGY